tara:strand:- start:1900 stop:2226 length:327 start_codon:yes stop_codon:yes gene_type:complete
MGKLVYIILLIGLIGCSNSTYHSLTGNKAQSDLIERTFQHAMEYNADGVISHWQDKNTGKSGTVMPKYASYKYEGPCRHFDITYYRADHSAQYHSGIACRRGQVWRIH